MNSEVLPHFQVANKSHRKQMAVLVDPDKSTTESLIEIANLVQLTSV